MASKSTDDIPIGDNTWITFVDVIGRQQRALAVDTQLQPLRPLFDRLETHCVAGCCGLQAFDFTSDAIADALPRFDRTALRQTAAAVLRDVDQLQADVVVSERLNTVIDRQTLLQLLQHIARVVD